jgi:nucleotide-binding universal stress UspA family protein
MNSILLPTDFSRVSKTALEYAAAIATQTRAVIDLVNVYNMPFIDASNVPPDYLDDMLMQKKEATLEKLREFARELPSEIKGELLPVYGLFIPQEIKDLTSGDKYDLVVMGTQGENHSAVEKILGSISTHTLMAAGCPVMTIPAEAEWKGIRNIAFATDFEPADQFATSQLISFAQELEAKVHFVHIETEPGIGRIDEEILVKNYPFEFSAFSVVNSKSVVEGLDHFVREHKIDLLALYIPKRRLLEKLFHGSFTKKMIFHAKIPLLVFHA